MILKFFLFFFIQTCVYIIFLSLNHQTTWVYNLWVSVSVDIDVCMCKHGCANIHLHIFEIVFNKTKWSGFYVSDTSSPALIQQDTISNACCTQEGERERELLIPHRYSGCGCVTVGVGVHTHVCICVNHRTK